MELVGKTTFNDCKRAFILKTEQRAGSKSKRVGHHDDELRGVSSSVVRVKSPTVWGRGSCHVKLSSSLKLHAQVVDVRVSH